MKQPRFLSELLMRWEDLRAQGQTLEAEELCGDHPELVGEVKRLIGVLQDFDHLAQTLSTGDTKANNALPSPPNKLPRVAGYEILAELGRGGMGVVYKARQTALKRLVALKMILSGAHAGKEHLGRFRSEAEAVARLQHPNIVQIYEVGEQDGLPYFSLELVEGGSLADRCAGQPVPAREAARLVDTLARAVQAAHERGIVHRDLKPANVLLQIADCRLPIENQPQDSSAKSAIANLQSAILKITDFGLAKLDAGSAEPDEHAPAQATASGAIMGTPSYMAPEQAAGKTHEAGPAADIYSLGAILYTLLTGRPPFQGVTLLDTLEQVCFQEPVPPSRLIPKVPRDLETVCLKCLRKEPDKRYATAEDLADDLARFQVGEPIRARPARLWERGLKWARRRPMVATLALSLVLVTALGFGLVTWKWLEAEENARKEARALQDTERARRTAEHNAVEAEKQRKEAVRRRKEAERERKVAERERKEAQERRQDLLAFIGIVRQVVDVYVRIPGLPRMQTQAMIPVRKDLMKVGLLFSQPFMLVPGEDPRIPAQRAKAYARLVHETALITSAAEAIELYNGAVKILDELAKKNPGIPQFQEELAESQSHLGFYYRTMGRYDLALPTWVKALELRTRLVRDHPGAVEHQDGLATSYNNLGTGENDLKHGRPAKDAWDKALEMRARLARDHPAVEEYRANLASTHANLGNWHYNHGQPGPGEKAYRAAIALREELAGKLPSSAERAINLAFCCDQLGNRLRPKDPREAQGWHSRAIEVLETALKGQAGNAQLKQHLARSYWNRAQDLNHAKRDKEALADADRAVAFDQGEQREALHYGRALILVSLDDHARATAAVKALLGKGPVAAGTLYNLARVYGYSIQAVPRDARASQAERDKLIGEYAAEALDLLGKARAAGHFKNAGSRAYLKIDPAFAALRVREPFKKILADLNE